MEKKVVYLISMDNSKCSNVLVYDPLKHAEYDLFKSDREFYESGAVVSFIKGSKLPSFYKEYDMKTITIPAESKEYRFSVPIFKTRDLCLLVEFKDVKLFRYGQEKPIIKHRLVPSDLGINKAKSAFENIDSKKEQQLLSIENQVKELLNQGMTQPSNTNKNGLEK